jgi:hypothetical protein
MTGESEFTRTVQAWLHQDAHEDPARLLAQVEERVASQRQDRPGLRIGRIHRGSRPLQLGLAMLAAAFVIAAVIVIRPAPSIGPQPSTSPPPTPGPSFDPSVPGLANDEPCTRTWPTGELALPSTPFHHEDLERMVLTAADVGGLAGFEQDVFRQGYEDNAELSSIEVGPPTTCEDVLRLGRIEGYGNAYASADGGGAVLFAVHLFWTAEEAAQWVDAFTTGLELAAEASGGGIAFAAIPNGLDIAEAGLYEHIGPEGTRTWAIIERGPVVGWIVDLHEGAEHVDVPAAARQMAERIELVSADALARPPAGLDGARLLSAPLPRSAYGELAEGLDWDPFFGGCQDTAERSFIVGPQAIEDAQRFGRVTGCTGMFSAPGGATQVVRVFSIVQVHRDEAPSGALAANVADVEARGGVRFEAAGIGDEAVGVAAPASSGEEGGSADTRVVVHVGTNLLVVSIQGSSASGREAEVVELARELASRVRALTEG